MLQHAKPKKFNMDYNFHRTLLTDAHSKHILIISVIYSYNLRKLHEWFSEFEWDENRTQKRKSNWLLIKKIQLQQHEHLEASESHIMGWGYYKWNNAVLSLQYSKKYELLLLSKGSLKVKLVCYVCRHMAKLWSYILYKRISLRNVIKEKNHSSKDIQSFTMGFCQVSKKSNIGVNIFGFSWKNIFLWRKFIKWRILTQSS